MMPPANPAPLRRAPQPANAMPHNPPHLPTSFARMIAALGPWTARDTARAMVGAVVLVIVLIGTLCVGAA